MLINGGGTREENFASHLAHLRELSAHLLATGLARDRITILSSDGDHPTADFAKRGESPEGFWQLEGTHLEPHLAEPLQFENSAIPGLPLRPATRSSLGGWLRGARAHMRAGDTLLIYVTDHGQIDERDPLRNEITLWGKREGINVRQLAAQLVQLPAGVRVVTIMSQCFSGGFARLQEVVPRDRTRPDAWSGPVCGYFASPADRPAYGCYPESSSGDRMGHAFTLIDALASKGRLPEVHAQVLLADQSPDVPLRSSDQFLAEVLTGAAAAARLAVEPFADRLLSDAHGTAAAAVVAQAAQVARAYDLPGPLNLTTLGAQIDQLATARERLNTQQTLWVDALADANRTRLRDFLQAQPGWKSRLRLPQLRRLSQPQRRELTAGLLAALDEFAALDHSFSEQITAVLDRADDTAALAYRMEVREAAWLRVRVLLTSAAARVYLQSGGSPARELQLAALEDCEAFSLPAPLQRQVGPPARPDPTPPFPALAGDQTIATQVHPSWLGIAFRPPTARLRRQHRLPTGAALVTAVIPRSPATAAGIATGDIVLGPPGQPFECGQPGSVIHHVVDARATSGAGDPARGKAAGRAGEADPATGGRVGRPRSLTPSPRRRAARGEGTGQEQWGRGSQS